MPQPDHLVPTPSAHPQPPTEQPGQEAALADFLSLLSGVPPTSSATPSPAQANSEPNLGEKSPNEAIADNSSFEPSPAPRAATTAPQERDQEVSVLQDILLGPKLTEYRDRISNMEEEMTVLKQNVHQVSEVIQEFAPAIQSMLEDQFNRIEKSLHDEIREMITPLSKEVQSLREHMGQDRVLSIQVSAVPDES
ncbi:MAG: hypothetical protein F6K30_15445 [Cyanothece sp. SIO2G6]|nr:hypothetical protein [Cyanothece sp. SIO2G6]